MAEGKSRPAGPAPAQALPGPRTMRDVPMADLRELRRSPLGFMVLATRRYGDFVRYPLGSLAVHLATHPDYVRHVLQDSKWYLLSMQPAAYRTVRSELDRVLGDRLPTLADLPELAYTRMVFDEALRLYPPAWIITRKSLAADQIGPYRVAAGALVVLSSYVTHRLPQFWPNPEGFDPERFSDDQVAGRPRFAYFPFGGGPRLCIGNTFAILEAQLVLASVAGRYRLDLVPGQNVEPEPSATLRPKHGLCMVAN